MSSPADSARAWLLAQRGVGGHWKGRLSSSALSTATAATALSLARTHGLGAPQDDLLIARGRRWLEQNQNADGGWGDTTLSASNISTTTLCWAALMPQKTGEAWLTRKLGAEEEGIDPARLALAIIERYGDDRTFSVPILTMAALAGRLGEGVEAWKDVIPLPFELAAAPRTLFAALRLPVVSYALPALIAIGQVHHVKSPSKNGLVRRLREGLRRRTAMLLETLQPENGGFLEATPLTSFVAMSLAAIIGDPATPNDEGTQALRRVLDRCLAFLRGSARADGSWPIDTNLATWVTTLSINALGPDGLQAMLLAERHRLADWLLGQQYHRVHPYTGAPPGGWAWTDLPGGVPDADDTAGALLALKTLSRAGVVDSRLLPAAGAGIRWLLGLQNSDGGMPTFCKGWGALEFDRSSPDLTAHALRAWHAWKDELDYDLKMRVESAIRRALRYLENSQLKDGSWEPLWFGNEHRPGERNPVYGTSRVMQALAEFPEGPPSLVEAGRLAAERMACGLLDDPSCNTEELALITTGLNAVSEEHPLVAKLRAKLAERIESGRWMAPAPIGFYFARLWYFEELYPAVFTVEAMRSRAGTA